MVRHDPLDGPIAQHPNSSRADKFSEPAYEVNRLHHRLWTVVVGRSNVEVGGMRTSRRLVWRWVVLAVVLGWTPVRAADESSVDQWISVMTDRAATAAARVEAEDRLRATLDPAMLPRLAPLLDRFASDPGCGTGRCHASELASRAGAQNLPIDMQIDHAVNRSWLFAVEQMSDDQVVGQLLPMVESAIEQQSRGDVSHPSPERLLAALEPHWNAEVQRVVRSLYARDGGLGWTALRLLAIHDDASWTDELFKRMNESGDDLAAWCRYLGVAGEPEYVARWGRDRRFIDAGFARLESLRVDSYTDQLYAESLVVALQTLAGETFQGAFSTTSDEPQDEVAKRLAMHRKQAVEKAIAWWRAERGTSAKK